MIISFLHLLKRKKGTLLSCKIYVLDYNCEMLYPICAVSNLLQSRKLDAFFETEEKLLNKQLPDRPIVEMLKDAETGSAEDKLRLALLHYMLTDHISDVSFRMFCVGTIFLQ